MALKPARDLGPYPQNCTDESWKTAKTESARDKWRTNVGAALRAAETAYNKVNVAKLDMVIFTSQNPQQLWNSAEDVKIAYQIAREHDKAALVPARKALAAAIKSAKTTSANPIISAQSRAKAKQIVKDLTTRLAQLESFTTNDFRKVAAELTKEAKEKLYRDLREKASTQPTKKGGDKRLNLKNVK
jgi:hypothetical protein